MKGFLRRWVERTGSVELYVIMMRLFSFFVGARLTVAVVDGLVQIYGYHFIPSVRRLPFYLRGMEKRMFRLREEYLVDLVEIKDGDVVVDCGANTGDFLFALGSVGKNIKYIGFEPGLLEYDCLLRNTSGQGYEHASIYRKALADKDGTAVLHVNTECADNSLLEIRGEKDVFTVETARLDGALAHVPHIKLFKLEAEGYEPEVLLGASGALNKIEFVAADVGFERGLENSSTLPQVTNYLLSNGFEVLAVGRKRLVMLYRNKNFK
jgi:FkbM family methyltransferase